MPQHNPNPARRASDPNMTGLFMQAPAMIMILEGPELRCTFANPLFTKLYEGRQLLGRSPREVAPELEGQGYFEMLDAVYATGQPVYGYEYPGVADWNNEGRESTKYFNMVYAPYQSEGQTVGVMIFGFEVTAQVEARQRADREEERMGQLLEALPLMAWTAGPDGAVRHVNSRWYAYTGQGPDEALSSGWAAAIPEAEQAALATRWAQCLREGRTYEAEMHYRRHDGELRWHSARAEPIRDADGSILYWLGVSADIHEQKTFAERLERVVSERTLALRRSNEELEQFAYIASHDLKEPLRKILIFSERALAEPAGDPLAQVERIRDAARRMRDLVEDLLAFSSIQSASRAFYPVDLNEVLAESLQDHELQIQEKGAEVSAGPLPVVPGIRHQLHQLFSNLMGNALKYSRPGVAPKVRIDAGPAAAADLARFPELDAAGSYVLIRIADNGIGFNPGDAERIFTLFQRLHNRAAYTGTGVGLALCRKVAQGHGGEVFAAAVPGEGAVFSVLLPA